MDNGRNLPDRPFSKQGSEKSDKFNLNFRNIASVCATSTICVGTDKEKCPKRDAFRMEKNGKMWELFPRVRTPPPSMEPHVYEKEKVIVYFAF